MNSMSMLIFLLLWSFLCDSSISLSIQPSSMQIHRPYLRLEKPLNARIISVKLSKDTIPLQYSIVQEFDIGASNDCKQALETNHFLLTNTISLLVPSISQNNIVVNEVQNLYSHKPASTKNIWMSLTRFLSRNIKSSIPKAPSCLVDYTITLPGDFTASDGAQMQVMAAQPLQLLQQGIGDRPLIRMPGLTARILSTTSPLSTTKGKKQTDRAGERILEDTMFPTATPTSSPTHNSSINKVTNHDSSDSLSHDSIIGLVLGLAIIILGVLRISCCFSRQWLRCCGYYAIKPEEQPIPVCEMQPIVATYPIDTPQLLRYHQQQVQVHPDPAAGIASHSDSHSDTLLLRTPIAVPVHGRTVPQSVVLQQQQQQRRAVVEVDNGEAKQDEEEAAARGGRQGRNQEIIPTVHAYLYHDEIADTYPSYTPYSIPNTTVVHPRTHNVNSPNSIAATANSSPMMVMAQPVVYAPPTDPAVIRGLVLGGDDLATGHILSGIRTQMSPHSTPLRGQHPVRHQEDTDDENHSQLRSASPT